MPNLLDLPDVEGLEKFVHKEILYDSLVKKSVDGGYMTERELLVGRYVSAYLDLNYDPYVTSEDGRPSHKGNDYFLNLVLFCGCMKAEQLFNVSWDKAREFYRKSLDIRAIQIPDFPREKLQWSGNKKSD
jgi:hypothetical protein